MEKLLSGKNALVTGSSQGLGEAIASALAADGARVLVTGRDGTKTEAAAARIRARGSIAEAMALDLTAPGAAERLVREAEERLGGLDILVNNAGVFLWKKFLDLGAEDWDRTLATNLSVPFRLIQSAAKAMIKRGSGGSIVNIASIHGKIAEAELAAHSAAKSGLLALTRAAALALREHDIRVNAICPGAIEPNSADRRGTSPREKVTQADIATLAAYLASDLSKTITGSAIDIHGSTRTVIKV